MKWIIHIGTPKTGSKAIQNFLAHETDRLRALGCFYPSVGRNGCWHRSIHEELERGETGLLARAAKQAGDSGCKFAILSYEGLFRLPAASIERFRDKLGEARIVMFLRRQDDLTDSRYNQLIKAHRVGIDRIVSFENGMLDYDPDMDHLKTIDKWKAVFGHDGVVPVIYDKGRNVVDDFFRAVGVAVDTEGLMSGNPNPALDAVALQVFRELKARVGDTDQLPVLVNAARELLREHLVDTCAGGIDPRVLSREKRERIRRHYRDSNERLRKTYFPERNELFPPSADAPDPVDPGPVDEALIERILEYLKA